MPDEIDLLRLFRDEMPGPSTDAWTRARAAVAAAESQERPSGRRRRRRPGRRRVIRAAAGLAAAAALAGLLAVLLPADGGEQVQTAAFVTHVENALAAAGQDNLVEYARTVYPSGDAATSGASTVTWAHQDTLRIATFDAAGQRVSDESVTPLKDGVPHQVTVNYPDRTWSSGPLGERRKRQADLPGCDLPLPGPRMIVSSGGWPVLIRDALSCGLFRMDGRQRVDGIDAIKLDFPDGGTAMWIDPATYLPVRMVLTYRGEQAQTDFRWLSPTSASLAQLTVPIPAGFRQVAPDSRAIHLST